MEVSSGAVRQVREMWENKTGQFLGPRWNAAFEDWIKKYGVPRVIDAIQKASIVKFSDDGERISPNILDVPAYAHVEQADDDESGMGECYLLRGKMRVKFHYAEQNDGDVLMLLRRALRAGVSSSAMRRAVEENDTLEDCFVSLGTERVEFRITMGQSIVDLKPKGRFFIGVDTPEWRAWDEFGRKTRGKGWPINKEFGWYFPTQWPPADLPPKKKRSS
jgi:hypothetical protein